MKVQIIPDMIEKAVAFVRENNPHLSSKSQQEHYEMVLLLVKSAAESKGVAASGGYLAVCADMFNDIPTVEVYVNPSIGTGDYLISKVDL